MRTLWTVFAAAAAAAILISPGIASADDGPFVTLDLGGSYAPNDPYDDQFTVGAHGGLGLYYGLAPQLALGARIDGIVLPEDDDRFEDDNYGFGSLMGALRLRPLGDPADPARATGLFIEGAVGGAIVEDDERVAFAAGIGWNFEAGPLGIGPTVRYTQVIERDQNRFDGEDARILTAGLEVVFLDDRPEPRIRTRRAELAEPPVAAKPEEPQLPPPPIPEDEELEPKAEEAPAEEPEAALVFVDDRLVLDERVFFDFDRAELRPRGREVLDFVASEWRSTGDDWDQLRVEGHADERGPASYNVDLSRRRAENVKSYLVQQGMPEELIDVQAYGESRPLVEDATTEREYQLNRRVQFEIVRQ